MALDRVDISFNSRPDLTIRGRKVDFDQAGEFRIGDKTFRGFKLDNDTFLQIRPQSNGRYDLTLISTGNNSLDRWNAKLRGGQVRQIESNKVIYTAKRARSDIAAGRLSFREDGAFARSFRQNATTELGDKLRKAGFQVQATDIYRLSRSGKLTKRFLKKLLDSDKPFDKRNKLLQKALNGNQRRPDQLELSRHDSADPAQSGLKPYDQGLARGLAKIFIENKEKQNNITFDPQTRKALQKRIEQESAKQFQASDIHPSDSNGFGELVSTITEQVLNDHLSKHPVRKNNPNGPLQEPDKQPEPIRKAQQFVQNADKAQDDFALSQQQHQDKLKQHVQLQSRRKQKLDKARRNSEVNPQQALKRINRTQGRLYLDKAHFGDLLKQARAPDGKDKLGDRTGFPPLDLLNPPAVTKQGAEKAILDAFENHPDVLSHFGDKGKEKIAVEALKDYIALPPDPPNRDNK